MSSPHRSLVNALAARAPAAEQPAVLEIAESFAEELSRYAELIVSPGGAAFGFMTRGEGPDFTRRVAAALQRLALPAHASVHHAALAGWFDHLRGFAKFEWHRGAQGSLVPMAAVYFRRRPTIEVALAKLESMGVQAQVREPLRELAATLEKASVHFVSAAFLRDAEVQHKLYFSQLVIDERKPAIEDRLRRVFDKMGLGELLARWLPLHRHALQASGETTLYVSVNFTADRLVPTVKIDYAGQWPAQVAAWAAGEVGVGAGAASDPRAALQASVQASVQASALAAVERESAEVAQAMASGRLAYLGVRFDVDQWPPRLKYYADQHGDAAA
jgi:hypothetical protein